MFDSEIPKEMKAVIVQGNTSASVKEVPVPKPEMGQILVKVEDVALNPTGASLCVADAY